MASMGWERRPSCRQACEMLMHGLSSLTVGTVTVPWIRSSTGAPMMTMFWSHRWKPLHDVMSHHLGWSWIYQWFFFLLLRWIHFHGFLIICHRDGHCSFSRGTLLFLYLPWFREPILCCPTEPMPDPAPQPLQPSLGIMTRGAWKLNEW